MRVIKFRAWDGRIMIFCGKGGYNDFIIEGGELSKFGEFSANERHTPDYPLMQFTGLLDKNGVEIYEGDILYWDGSIIGAVSFEYAEFICGVGINARNLCNAPINDIAVIGNIYENPEFLEAK